MKNKSQIIALLVFLNVLFFGSQSFAQNQNTNLNYDKEQVKKEYRLFLEQLKELNAQYKEVTGEIAKVVKEEGVPTWDMGEAGKELDKNGKTNADQTEMVQDLAGGVQFSQTDKEMKFVIELPGYKKDSIKLSFQGNEKVIVSATRKIDNMAKSYERTIDLPFPGDSKNTVANYEDGLLIIKIPKIASKEVAIPIK